MMKNDCVLPDSSGAREFVEENVAKDLKKYGMRKELTRAVAGYVGGRFAEGMVLEDPEEESTWFPFLTAALATKRIRTKLRNRYESFIKVNKNSHLTPDEQTLVSTEKYLKNNVGMADIFGADVSDNQLMRELNDVWRTVKLTARGGEDGFEKLMQTRWTQSGFSFLASLGVQSAKAYRDFILGVNTFIKRLSSAPAVKFDNKYGNGAYDTFVENGRNLYREVTGRAELTDLDAKLAFDDAVGRILDSGGRLDESGRYIYNVDDKANIRLHYEQNPDDLLFDERMLKNESFLDFIDSNRANFNTYSKEYQTLVNDEITRTIAKFIDNPLDKQALQELRNTHLGFREFKKIIRTTDKETYDRLNKLHKTKAGAKVIDLTNKAKRFRKYEDNYFPHMFSTEKENRMKARWMQANAEKFNFNEDKIQNAWEDYIVEETYKVNQRGRKNRRVIHFDKDGGVIVDKEFKKRQDALEFLYQQRAYIGDEAFQNPEKFIKEVEVGEDVRYFIEPPENLPDVFEKYNKGAYRESTLFVRNGAYVKQSNHLDNARQTLLPTWLMETDINKVSKKYALDAGRRIYNLRAGVWDESDLRGKLLKPIVDELQQKIDDPKKIQAITSRLEALYNGSMRIMGKSVEEVEKAAKLNKAVQLYRNVKMAAYGWGMAFYTPFEVVQQATLLSSWKSAYNTFKHYTTAGGTEKLNNMTNFLTKEHIMSKHINTHVGDYDNLTEELMAGGIVDGWERFTGNLAEHVTQGSFTKMAMWLSNQALGTRFKIDDLGIARVVFDGFVGGNLVSTAVNARASLNEFLRMGSLYKQFKNVPEGQFFINEAGTGKNWTRKEIIRKMENYGVTTLDEIEHFSDNLEAYEKFVMGIDDGSWNATLPLSAIEGEQSMKRVHDTIHKVVSFATESMHGTNPAYRPDAATGSGLGQLAYQFTTYPINLVVQNFSRRVTAPIKEFNSKYVLKGDGKPNKMGKYKTYLLYKYYKKGNIDMLKKEFGFTDAMIEDFPYESVEHALKATGMIFGFGVASSITLAALNDLVSYPINDYYGEEQWKRLNYQLPAYTDEDGNERTFGDMVSDTNFEDALRLFGWAGGQLTRFAAGSYGNILNQAQYSNSQITDLTPITGDAAKLYDLLKGAMNQKSAPNAALYAGRESAKMVADNLPLINSRPFNAIKSALMKRRLEKGGVKLRDTQSNNYLDYNFTLDNFETSFDIDL